jgi:hypothetical protein
MPSRRIWRGERRANIVHWRNSGSKQLQLQSLEWPVRYISNSKCLLRRYFRQICTKRGPLGACLKTEPRTDTNDNDVSRKYFRDPSDLIKQKSSALSDGGDDGNALIQKLRQQSIDNQEKNDLYVARKTFEADQVRALMMCSGCLLSLLLW